jgi:hypothetical protein
MKSATRLVLSLGVASVALASLASTASAAIPTNGNLVVLRVGDGTATLGTAATQSTLFEFNKTALSSPVQSVNLSATPAYQLVNAGSATSEGYITVNAGMIAVAGYDGTVGTAGISGSTAAANRRILGFSVNSDIAAAPAINYTLPNASFYTSSAFRSAAAASPTEFYTTGGNQGQYLVNGGGSGTATLVSSTVTNSRVVAVSTFAASGGGTQTRLLFSHATATTPGVNSTGVGLPTSSVASSSFAGAVHTVSGSPFSSTASHSSFSISPNGLTMYIADDAATSPAVHKLVRSIPAGAFTFAYSIRLNTGGSSATGARGLVVDYFTGGFPVIYATTTETSANRLVSVVDDGITTSGTVGSTTANVLAAAATLLQTAPANTAFRGVALIPEPATLACFGAAGVATLARRRRA